MTHLRISSSRKVKIPDGYWFECECRTSAEAAVRSRSEDEAEADHFLCPTIGCNVLLFPKRRKATGKAFFESQDRRSGGGHALGCPFGSVENGSVTSTSRRRRSAPEPIATALLIPTVMGSALKRRRRWDDNVTDDDIRALKGRNVDLVVAGSLEDIVTAYLALKGDRHLHALSLADERGTYADRFIDLNEMFAPPSRESWQRHVFSATCTAKRGDAHGVVFLNAICRGGARFSFVLRNRYRDPNLGKSYLERLLPPEKGGSLPARVRLYWTGIVPTDGRIEPTQSEVANSFALRPVIE